METKEIIKKIEKKAQKIKRTLRFMELCGTHSETVARYDLKKILPPNILLVTGPGCPICVTDQTEADVIVGLALAKIPIAVYGDALNLPGNLGSLEEARQKGFDVNSVYDVMDALKLSQKKRGLVFWGIGFETTTPATAWGIKKGLTVFSSHKTFVPAMETLLKNKKIKIDGFINPGHVSAIIGTKVYERFFFPQVVTGFEVKDVLLAVDMLLNQIISGKPCVENEYTRLVKKRGNKKALKMIADVFEVKNGFWRGLGEIEKSGLKIKKEYQNQDAEFVYKDLIAKIKKEIKTKKNFCRCGEVLQGIIEPKQCSLFGKFCVPENPQGACMVSQEGSCNIEYRINK